MRLWRISQYPGLSGEGGELADGRWHHRPRRVLYASEHPALAMAEVLAHLRLPIAAIPTTLKLIGLDVADDAARALPPDLPGGWQANEPTTRALGDAWLDAGTTLLLPVPSAVIAHAGNWLINPAHPEAAVAIREVLVEPFWFDRRYLR